MKNYKYAIVIVDDKQKYWVDDYEDLSSSAKTIRYEFENQQQLLESFETIPYEGFWYFLIDENNNTLVSGAFDIDDYECIEQL